MGIQCVLSHGNSFCQVLTIGAMLLLKSAETALLLLSATCDGKKGNECSTIAHLSFVFQRREGQPSVEVSDNGR